MLLQKDLFSQNMITRSIASQNSKSLRYVTQCSVSCVLKAREIFQDPLKISSPEIEDQVTSTLECVCLSVEM